MAVHKPSGIHVHRTALSAGEPALVEILQRQVGHPVYPVHRLDRPTSGLLLFALSAPASSKLCAAFRDRQVRKIYWALVRGWPQGSFTVDKPVRLERREDLKVDALTDFRVLDQFESPWPWRGFPTFRSALLEVQPQTGRRHQIRQHCDALSHPVLGDSVWGDTRLNNHLKLTCGLDRLMLFCRSMEFPHPRTGEPLCLEAPLSEVEKELLAKFGWTENPASAN